MREESVFKLAQASNPQNDCVWAKDRAKVPPCRREKRPKKGMVWGDTSALGVTELHVVPQKQSVKTEYYMEEILDKALTQAVERTANTGPINQRKMVRNMSTAFFMQDGAPPQTALMTQEFYLEHLPGFWEREN